MMISMSDASTPTSSPPEGFAKGGGFLLIDKPAGMTSHDVVDAIRRLFGCTTHKARKAFKVGHAGTLDPFATGLLIVGIGKATKRLPEIVGLDKTYEAIARLGATSTTDDLEGMITEKEFGIWNLEFGTPDPDPNSKFQIPNSTQLEETLNLFRGGYTQTAPVFSAKKVGGKKLYQHARRGTIDLIERPKKAIVIDELIITKYEWPNLAFTISCSSGTYIRALARDIGDTLGCGAYLTALRRTRIGKWNVNEAVPLGALTKENVGSFVRQL